MKESFARTALELVSEGRPFTDILTTDRFMMTTALKSLYMQIEMPYDIHTMTFQFNHGSRPPIEESIDPQSPNYMVFGYAAPTTSSGKKFTGTCAGDATKISTYPGNTYLFQVLLGAAPRDSSNNSAGTTALGCMEHAIQPYFTAQDLSDWQMVTIATSGTPLNSFDLPALRAATTLGSKLPRVSFFTTPAFLAVWNTNDSNQHRVTANQALLGALGQGFLNAEDAVITPPTLVAVNGDHASNGACYGCHKALDPMRQFWAMSYDYSDRTDGKGKGGGAPSFGFDDVAQDGKTLVDFGTLLAQVGDAQVADSPRESLRARHGAEALLLRQLVEMRGDGPRAAPRCAGVPEFELRLQNPRARAVLLAARHGGDGHRDLRRERRDHQRRTPRPALRGALQPARHRRPVRDRAADADRRDHRDEPLGGRHGCRRVQPRLAIPRHAHRSEPLLPRGE